MFILVKISFFMSKLYYIIYVEKYFVIYVDLSKKYLIFMSKLYYINVYLNKKYYFTSK